MLVTSNPIIYWHEVCNLLVENSNTLHDTSDVSLTTIKKIIQFRMENDKNWTRKRTLQCNDMRWTEQNIIYTQLYFNTIALLNPDDILFMDESSVHINCGVRRYGSSKKGQRAVHFSKHVVDANFTLHVIAGLHGKMYYEVTSGPSTSMMFINFI